ncbi:non-ribosomal peptide synthetase, partial [Actinoplanes sp. ATCC 53533]|uniref:non-ribosomal peptide synthetase n=1 Tax=Actinoplanes sp. ATCC 53533 TaxID=1288362 RepID=UPI0010002223
MTNTPPVTDLEVAPASFAQRRMWFLEQLEAGAATYNVQLGLRISGPLRLPLLRQALAETVRRHETLRTTLAWDGGELSQVIAPPGPVELPVLDVAGLLTGGGDDVEAALDRLAQAELARPFDPATEPPIRAAAIRLPGDEHILLITLDHLVGDAWSMQVLYRELATLYGAFHAGEPSPLPDLPIQYADFAAWQRDWLAGGELDRQLGYWRGQLGDEPPRLTLPGRVTAAATETAADRRSATSSQPLSDELLAALDGLGRAEGASLFMVLLAAFATLLNRYEGQEDVVIGSLLGGRHRAEVEPLIGFFVNTVALRVDLTGRPTFRQLLGRVREMTLDAYAHQDVPFEQVVADLEPERDGARQPFFDVMFQLADIGRDAVERPGLRITPFRTATAPAPVGLVLAVVREDGHYVGVWDFDEALISRSTVERMQGHFAALLESVVVGADVAVSELGLLGGDERRWLVELAAGAVVEVGDGCALPGWFEERVRLCPDAVAVVCGGEVVSFGELNVRANRLAWWLRSRGVGAESLVGLFLDRGVELVVAVLGVLKAGGAYVPLDPGYPADRVAFMVADSRPGVVLTRAGVVDRLPVGVSGVVLEDVVGELAGCRVDDPVGVVGPDNLAYVIYTSGSTGRPKGAAVTHRGLTNFLYWLRGICDRGGRNGTLLHSPVSFDFTVSPLFLPLITGRDVTLLPEVDMLEHLAVALLEPGRDLMLIKLTPAHLIALYARLGPDVRIDSVRIIMTGGEQLPAESVADWRRIAPNAVFLNEYGPTETVVGSSIYEVPDDLSQGPVPIGLPITNTQLHVADSLLRLVPVGAVGELYIGGLGVCRGYLGRPGLTAGRFLPDPYSGVPGARLYRTGDLVRRRPDGVIEFLGRVDDQVKIRGYRIEPADVEAALLSSAKVAAAHVTAGPSPTGGLRLIGYVVPVDRLDPPSTTDLRAHLSGILPAYMHPTAWVTLDSMPFSANGKVDRRALPAPDPADPVGRYEPPATAAEREIAAVWERVLARDRVGAVDNFFDLGGHSLLAIQLVNAINRETSAHIGVRDLFTHPTIRGLAVVNGSGDGPAWDGVTRRPPGAVVPLSLAQRRVWFMSELGGGSPEFNVPFGWRVRGALDVGVLRGAVLGVVARHEVLRSVFVDGVDGVAVGVGEARVGWVERAVDGWAEALVVARGEELVAFDLRSDPLVRVTVVRLGVDDFVVLFVVHHIVFDGWSMGLFVGELAELYAAGVAGRAAVLPELAVQYGDVAAWQREMLSGEVLAGSLTYWRRQLAGLVPAELPGDGVRSDGAAAGAVRFAVPAEVVSALRSMAAGQGATLFMVVMAAVQLVVSRWSGSRDVSVGSPVAGRGSPEVDGLVGLFFNVLVLRTDLSGDPTFGELVGRVREVVLGAFEHQDVPFERLVEELAPQRRLDQTPLFQVWLELNNTTTVDLALPGATTEELAIDPQVAKFDLSVSLRERDGGLVGLVGYRSGLFSEAWVRRFVGALTGLLSSVASGVSGVRVSGLPVVSAGGSLLAGGLGVVRALADGGVHEWFEDRVRSDPAGVAVVCGGVEVSYGELNARVNRLAHYLIGLGVGAEARVGVCVERGVDMVVALLAVLKAGGAYVPLDPGFPVDRIGFMIADTGARVVLTQGSLMGRFRGYEGRLVCVDTVVVEGFPVTDPVRSTSAESLAYVIYTSGSTGRPKGVLVEHGGLANFVRWCVEGYSGRGVGGAPVFSSIGFDAVVPNLFGPLIAGQTVHLLPEGFDIARLGELLVAGGPYSFIKLTPSHLDLLTAQLTPAEAAGLAATVVVGAESFSAASLEYWRRLAPDVVVLNEYGPTEVTVANSVFQADGLVSTRTVPIGRPIPNTWMFVVDYAGELAEIGVTGELLVGGTGVVRGYHGRPDLTADKFIPDRFGPVPGGRLYRTGDLARVLPDGNVEFLGRSDDQIKIRGYRVEPGEVEAAVVSHPMVTAAHVTVADDLVGGPQLVGYVVPADAPAPAVLREYLSSRLPAYMHPTAWVFLDGLPLNPNGKIDRKALPTPGTVTTSSYQPPVTPAEHDLTRIWQTVLGRDRIGVFDNFFDLGGHSLLAIQLVNTINRETSAHIGVRDLFTHPTIRDLAGLTDGAAVSMRSGVTRRPPGAVVPLSLAQRRVWFMSELGGGSPEFNVPFGWRVRGALDVGVLRGAVLGVVARHEVLRSVFVDGVDGVAVGVGEPRVGWVERAVDGWAEALVVARGEELVAFDLRSDPLVRVTVVRLGVDDFVVLFVVHHIVFDGWSMGLFVGELAELYAAGVAGRAAVLPELAVQYGDVAAWQEQASAGAALADSVTYWRTQLAGLSVATLPGDRPTPATLPAESAVDGRAVRFVVDGEVTNGLRTLAADQGATLFMVVMAAVQLVVSRWSGSRDVSVGSPVAGRGSPEVDGLVGLFFNVLVLRTDLSGDPTFGELVGRVREVVLGAFEHQDVPFERLVEELAPPRQAAGSPFFQVWLEMNPGPGGPPALAGLDVSALDLEPQVTKFDLSLSVAEHGETLDIVLGYRSGLFSEAWVRRFVGALTGLLSSVASGVSGVRVSGLPVVSAGGSLLAGGLGVVRALADGGVHEWFEDRVRSDPAGVAVVCGGVEVSYGELNARVNRLAHYLIGLGVGAEARVGVCVERGVDMVVALLAVLKAGGAYVPLDPGFPVDRIGFMIADTGARVVLTQGSLMGRFRGYEGRLVCVDTVVVEGFPVTDPVRSTSAESLAYVIYTSGSTGRP